MSRFQPCCLFRNSVEISLTLRGARCYIRIHPIRGIHVRRIFMRNLKLIISHMLHSALCRGRHHHGPADAKSLRAEHQPGDS